MDHWMDLLGHVEPYNYNSSRIWMDKIPLQVCQLLNDGRIVGHSSFTIVQHRNLGCRGSIKILDLDTCKVMGLKCTRSPMHLLMEHWVLWCPNPGSKLSQYRISSKRQNAWGKVRHQRKRNGFFKENWESGTSRERRAALKPRQGLIRNLWSYGPD